MTKTRTAGLAEWLLRGEAVAGLQMVQIWRWMMDGGSSFTMDSMGAAHGGVYGDPQRTTYSTFSSTWTHNVQHTKSKVLDDYMDLI